MSVENSFAKLGKYLKRINDSFDDKKSLTDVLNDFRCLSKDYEEYNGPIEKYDYSSFIYNECTDEEKEIFDAELESIQCLVTNNIYAKSGIPWSWKDIYTLIFDDLYAKVEKTQRRVVFSVSTSQRPIGDVGYTMWNGMQIIDIDIKDATIAAGLKPLLFDDLKKFHWFLGICTSASGKSLHIWTKITPLSVTLDKLKVEYTCNFRHKYSYVYIALLKYMNMFGYTKDKILEYMDMAMAKPQQGIFITSDKGAMLNTNFIDLRLDIDFNPAFDTGIESVNWLTHPDLKAIFAKLEWFTNDKFDEKTNVEISAVSNINERDLSKSIRKHYKHAQRWQLANTLCSLYGYDKALQIMTQITLGTEYKELKGDVKTASIHDKPISMWAVKELNKYHGFKIKINNADEVYKAEEERMMASVNAVDPTNVLNSNKENLVELHIENNQYLSDIKDDILKNLSHITLLEAGAGFGKTEMIKAFKAKTLLILPFTSTIKSKVESSATTSDWLYYYGNKRPSLDDLMGQNSMTMTIDKFSRLNLMELDSCDFEYIVLDESHLLFTSSYRSVMTPTIQRLANCKAKVIMMSGTPTGELLFFPNIKHIKVTKTDNRIKEFQLHFCPTAMEVTVEIAKAIAADIMNGKKILFPTNKGNLYMEELTGLIRQVLTKKEFARDINVFYYKKSNYLDDSMDDINIDKTIGNNDIVFCTTYLSVGVDICDRYNFSVYFDEIWIPQDIEQFANRLRNNDLYLNLYLPRKDFSGNPINYYFTQNLDLSIPTAEKMFCINVVRTCNDMIERNNEESRYNPLIQSLLAQNKYLKYDENTCRYYIDETTYKLNVFEERYSEYTKQLEIMKSGMEYYGYTMLEPIEHKKEFDEFERDTFKEYIRNCRNAKFETDTVETFAFLKRINDNNIDFYKEAMVNNDIFKSEKYREVREEHELYINKVEIVEKNLPIILHLYKFYDMETIYDIFDFCKEIRANRINYSKLDRICRFCTIEANRRKNRIDFPMYKFIKESREWATKNFVVTQEEINEYLQGWAAAYANTIKDAIVDDTKFFDNCYELIQNLWKVIIVQERPRKKMIKIRPFELLWTSRDSLLDDFGGAATKEFFIDELMGELHEEEPEEEVLPALPHTAKYTLKQVEKQVNNAVNGEFDFIKSTSIDGSQERFIEKQKDTNSLNNTFWDISMESGTAYELNRAEMQGTFDFGAYEEHTEPEPEVERLDTKAAPTTLGFGAKFKKPEVKDMSEMTDEEYSEHVLNNDVDLEEAKRSAEWEEFYNR